MTLFWWAASALALFAALLLLAPLFRRRNREALDGDRGMLAAMAIYRDQIAELEKEVETGRIHEEEARAAQVEIERRMLALDERGAVKLNAGPRSAAFLVTVAIAAPLSAFALYGVLGQPTKPDQPLAGREAPANIANAEQAGDMIERAEALAERLSQEGGSFEDWWLLAQSFLFLERFDDAAKAFKQAADIAPDNTDALGAYAETLIRAAQGQVTAEAELTFRKVLEIEPGDPRARYYVGLSAAQNERFDAALEIWQALYKDSPADAPWIPTVRQGLVDMANLLGVDPENVVPEPQPAELARTEALASPAQSASAEDIEALRARLEASPKDFEGWLQLARLEVANNNLDAARMAIARVREIYPGAPFVQQQIAKAEQELGLLGERRGPDQEQIAAAQDMTPEEQQEMIAGMVQGLAERLQDNPDDLQGWIMLMRSYGVLGDRDKAVEAYENARAHFAGLTEPLSVLENQARTSGLIR